MYLLQQFCENDAVYLSVQPLEKIILVIIAKKKPTTLFWFQFWPISDFFKVSLGSFFASRQEMDGKRETLE